MGIQEKITFVQFKAPLAAKDLRQPIVTLPGATLLLLGALGVLVMLHHKDEDAQASLKTLDSGELLEAGPSSQDI